MHQLQLNRERAEFVGFLALFCHSQERCFFEGHAGGVGSIFTTVLLVFICVFVGLTRVEDFISRCGRDYIIFNGARFVFSNLSEGIQFLEDVVDGRLLGGVDVVHLNLLLDSWIVVDGRFASR